MTGQSRSTEIDRWLDRSCGIPALAALGALRRKRAFPRAPQRIGLMQPTAIGDLVLNTGILLHLAALYPAAELHVFAGAANFSALSLLPVPIHPHLCRFRSFAATRAAIRAARLDIIIDPGSWPRITALYAALSGAFTIGFRTVGQSRHWAFDATVPYGTTVHVTENYRALAERFGPCPVYHLALTGDLPPAPSGLPYDDLIVCHAVPGGSRAREKSWPADHWAALTQRLARRSVLCFTGTAADAAAIDEILRRAGVPETRAFSLCGRLTLAELAALLGRARLVVSVDTGVLHIAAALDRPLVGLHGPTRSSQWGARSAQATSLDSPHPAAGFIHFGYEAVPQGGAVMAALTVEAVEAAVLARCSIGAAAGRP